MPMFLWLPDGVFGICPGAEHAYVGHERESDFPTGEVPLAVLSRLLASPASPLEPLGQLGWDDHAAALDMPLPEPDALMDLGWAVCRRRSSAFPLGWGEAGQERIRHSWI